MSGVVLGVAASLAFGAAASLGLPLASGGEAASDAPDPDGSLEAGPIGAGVGAESVGACFVHAGVSDASAHATPKANERRTHRIHVPCTIPVRAKSN
jgi:hypothetical protein